MSGERRVVQAYRPRNRAPTAENPYPTAISGAEAIRKISLDEAQILPGVSTWVEPIEVVAPGRPQRAPSSVGEPGPWESLLPIWGSGRGFIADLQEGDTQGAVLNGGLLALDLIGGGLLGRGLALGAKMMPKGRQGWKYVRSRFGKHGYIQPYDHGHHAIIPNNGWGKRWPNWVKNHPLNIKPLSPEHHMRVTHSSKNFGKQYDPVRRYIYGRPGWAQAADGAIVGRGVPDGREGQ